MFIHPHAGAVLGLQFCERACDLGLDLERLETLSRAAFVSCDHQLAHLFGEPLVLGPRDAGVVVDKHEDKMGQRASNTATVVFNDVEIPANHLVGEENKGFKIAMMTLDRTRPGVAAIASPLHESEVPMPEQPQAISSSIRTPSKRLIPGPP